VFNYTSTSTMPSHTFPNNPQMCEKWLKNLILKPYKENEINKLRVCYKHFKESDYTGSDKLRRLIRACVPFMITTETCTEITPINNIAEDQEQNIQQQQETITVLQENVAQLQTDIEIIFEKQEIVPQMQMKIENLSQQQEKQQKDLIQLQTNIEKLSQIQVQMQAQPNNQLQELTQTVESLKVQLYQNSQARRPNLANVTRKKHLSPTARNLYDNNIKLQAQKRRMKRIMNRMKQQNKLKKIILNEKKYKDQENRTTKIRESFVNMILRNNDVLPQISNP